MTNSMSDTVVRAKSHRWGRMTVIAVIVAALILLFRIFPVSDWLSEAFDWVKGLGPTGYSIFVGLYVIATVLGFPGSVLTLGAGAAYGVILGTVLVVIGATISAIIAFLIGRYLTRAAVARKLEGSKRFAAVDRAVGKNGFKIVFMTRLSPIFPYVLLNYMFGITKVSLRDYTIASFIGMIPGTVLYVYLGKVAADISTGTFATSTLQIILTYAGLAVTVLVTVYVTRIARAALREAKVVNE